MNDESWVSSSRTYQNLLQEVQRLNELLGAKAKDMEGLARERDEAQRDGHVKTQFYHVSALLSGSLT